MNLKFEAAYDISFSTEHGSVVGIIGANWRRQEFNYRTAEPAQPAKTNARSPLQHKAIV